MTYYPKIAELHYQDKNINIKIPIRIKKIVITTFCCTKCTATGTFSRIIKWIEEQTNYFDKKGISFDWWYDNKLRLPIPHPICNENGTINYCPVCKLERNKEIDMRKEEKFVYKAYITSLPKYININSLLSDFLPFHWRSLNNGRFELFLKEYQNFCDNLKRYKKETAADNKKEKNRKYKIIVHDVSMEELDKLHNNYLKRKFVRSI